ncbi:tannase/feruloyl esterase family alpha/beta hydrolase [Gammaproteobacteria bacterium]|nr:tannase/feruloyl esterase family alpha/beta hydrolase [Gammaproteobacteria bacterium]
MKSAALRYKALFFFSLTTAQTGLSQTDIDQVACEGLEDLRNLTLTRAEIKTNPIDDSAYCYVRGIISPAIHFHAQLPLPKNWNGRFLQWGDGGKDGDLDYANHRVAQGYAVTNSNLGHDSAVEPGASFGLNNRQAEIDFGYRAVHLTVQAGKRLIQQYYEKEQDYSYFEGCSQGGRQGFMSAQRYPKDFDGISAGAPAFNYQGLNAAGTWNLQRVFRDNLIGNLAVDSNDDGSLDSLALVQLLHESVLQRCDANDGVIDRLISDPLSCNFDPKNDLTEAMCPATPSEGPCFTEEQIETIADLYNGPEDSDGRQVYPGKMLGSELSWPGYYIPWEGNKMGPSKLTGVAGDHMNYLFYEKDPGVAVPDVRDTNYRTKTTGSNPEFHWIDWNIDDFFSGKGDLMKSITDANDPDLNPFLRDEDGKMIIYHGLTDTLIVASDTIDYYDDLIDVTFNGDSEAAKKSARLFLAPGMNHCGGGDGPNAWDKLSPLVDWVENGVAPESIIATHTTNGEIDNERPLCAYPKQAKYIGSASDASSPQSWRAENFQCQ